MIRKKIIEYFINNPHKTHRYIAQVFNTTPKVIGKYINIFIKTGDVCTEYELLCQSLFDF